MKGILRIWDCTARRLCVRFPIKRAKWSHSLTILYSSHVVKQQAKRSTGDRHSDHSSKATYNSVPLLPPPPLVFEREERRGGGGWEFGASRLALVWCYDTHTVPRSTEVSIEDGGTMFPYPDPEVSKYNHKLQTSNLIKLYSSWRPQRFRDQTVCRTKKTITSPLEVWINYN